MIGIVCKDTRECFAKNRALDGTLRCTILSGGYPGDTCPFCKKPGAVRPVSREELESVKAARRRKEAEKLEDAREDAG